MSELTNEEKNNYEALSADIKTKKEQLKARTNELTTKLAVLDTEKSVAMAKIAELKRGIMDTEKSIEAEKNNLLGLKTSLDSFKNNKNNLEKTKQQLQAKQQTQVALQNVYLGTLEDVYNLTILVCLQSKVDQTGNDVISSNEEIENTRKSIEYNNKWLADHVCGSGTGDDDKECQKTREGIIVANRGLESILANDIIVHNSKITENTAAKKELTDFEKGKMDTQKLIEEVAADLIKIGIDLVLTITKINLIIEKLDELIENIDKVNIVLARFEDIIPKYKNEIDMVISALTKTQEFIQKAIDLLYGAIDTLSNELVSRVEALARLIEKVVKNIKSKINNM